MIGRTTRIFVVASGFLAIISGGCRREPESSSSNEQEARTEQSHPGGGLPRSAKGRDAEASVPASLYERLKHDESWPDELTNREVEDIFKRLADDDLELAKRLALSAPDEIKAFGALKGLSSGWLPQDPAGCFDWLTDNSGSRFRLLILMDRASLIAAEDLDQGGDPRKWMTLARHSDYLERFKKHLTAAIASSLAENHEFREGLQRLNTLMPEAGVEEKRLYLRDFASSEPQKVLRYLDTLDRDKRETLLDDLYEESPTGSLRKTRQTPSAGYDKRSRRIED